MQDLIAIHHSEEGACISARDLHTFLGSKQDFTNWIKGRISTYDFTEGVDFSINLSRSAANRVTTEYALTIDMAKELAMVEGNAKGKQARRYFIEKEKELRQQQVVPAVQSPAELILMLAQQNLETERRMTQLEQQVTEVVAKVTTINTDYYTVAGFASLQRRRLSPQEANNFGRQAATLSRELGFQVTKVHDSRYGQVNNYHKEVLQRVLCR